MRLCVYSDSEVFGGAETVLGHLVAELDPAVEVTVMGVDPATVERIAAGRPSASAVVLPPVRGKFDLVRMWAHRRAIATARPDVFQINSTWLWSCRYALAASLTVPGVAVVAVEHSLFEAHYRRARVLKGWMSSRLAAHVTVGRSLCRTIEEAVGLAPGSVEAIPNGVPTARVTPRRLEGDGPVIGTAARIEPAKRIHLLLDAVVDRHDVRVAVVGDGPGRGHLERVASALAMTDRLHITGWTDDARSWIAGRDGVVLPSAREAMPLSVIEAMLAGVPVVATRVGAVPDAIRDGETGLLVEPSDDLALRDAVRRVLDDPALAKRLGEAGRAFAEEHLTAAAMARGYERLYERVAPAWRSPASR